MSSTTRKRAVRAVAPVAGLLAAGLLVWQGSYAAFSATTVNQGDAWATGTMVLKNNGGLGGALSDDFAGVTTAPLFAETDVEIGEGGSRCITVWSDGTEGGDLQFYASNLVDSTVGDTLAPQIDVTVRAAFVAANGAVAPDCSDFPGGAALVTASLDELVGTFDSVNAAATEVTVPDGQQRVAYRFDWTLNSTNDPDADNALQGSDVVVNFNWEMQGN